jgi:hypothetical protein
VLGEVPGQTRPILAMSPAQPFPDNLGWRHEPHDLQRHPEGRCVVLAITLGLDNCGDQDAVGAGRQGGPRP